MYSDTNPTMPEPKFNNDCSLLKWLIFEASGHHIATYTLTLDWLRKLGNPYEADDRMPVLHIQSACKDDWVWFSRVLHEIVGVDLVTEVRELMNPGSYLDVRLTLISSDLVEIMHEGANNAVAELLSDDSLYHFALLDERTDYFLPSVLVYSGFGWNVDILKTYDTFNLTFATLTSLQRCLIDQHIEKGAIRSLAKELKKAI